MTGTYHLDVHTLAEVLDRATSLGNVWTRDMRDVVIDHKGNGHIVATLWSQGGDGSVVELDRRTFRLVEVTA